MVYEDSTALGRIDSLRNVVDQLNLKYNQQSNEIDSLSSVVKSFQMSIQKFDISQSYFSDILSFQLWTFGTIIAIAALLNFGGIYYFLRRIVKTSRDDIRSEMDRRLIAIDIELKKEISGNLAMILKGASLTSHSTNQPLWAIKHNISAIRLDAVTHGIIPSTSLPSLHNQLDQAEKLADNDSRLQFYQIHINQMRREWAELLTFFKDDQAIFNELMKCDGKIMKLISRIVPIE